MTIRLRNEADDRLPDCLKLPALSRILCTCYDDDVVIDDSLSLEKAEHGYEHMQPVTGQDRQSPLLTAIVIYVP